jgi:hypothetical protein
MRPLSRVFTVKWITAVQLLKIALFMGSQPADHFNQQALKEGGQTVQKAGAFQLCYI